jgi:AraC-like DNA-binding protein
LRRAIKGERERAEVLLPTLPLDVTALSTFDIVEVRDPNEMDTTSRVSRRMRGDSTLFSYRLQDRALLRSSFSEPITIIAERRIGSMEITLSADRFATQVALNGDGVDSFCFHMMLQGKARLARSENDPILTGTDGAVIRGAPGTKILTSDVNARRSFWIEAATLRRALEDMLGDSLRRPLEFTPRVDWSSGLAASLKSQIDFLAHDVTRPDGVAANPVALASFTDLILSLVLRGIRHNHLERLENRGLLCAVPAYVRRAEEFMHTNAAMPMRMEQVADAAGCSVRTLEAVFRRFRDTTPLAALHSIRLDEVRTELSYGATIGSAADVARRYGFTNLGRFSAAYRLRFREAPSETTKRTSR